MTISLTQVRANPNTWAGCDDCRVGVKSMCHTPAFRREEKRFRHYREAIALIRSL